MRQNQEYKALLIDNIKVKESRVSVLNARKNQLIDHSQRMAQTLQDNFFKTAKTTNNAILP